MTVNYIFGGSFHITSCSGVAFTPMADCMIEMKMNKTYELDRNYEYVLGSLSISFCSEITFTSLADCTIERKTNLT